MWAETLRSGMQERIGETEKNVTVMGSFFANIVLPFCLLHLELLSKQLNECHGWEAVIERNRIETGRLWENKSSVKAGTKFVRDFFFFFLEMEEWKRRLVIAWLLASQYYVFLTFTHLPSIHRKNRNKSLLLFSFFFPLLIKDARWGGWMERRRKESAVPEFMIFFNTCRFVKLCQSCSSMNLDFRTPGSLSRMSDAWNALIPSPLCVSVSLLSVFVSPPQARCLSVYSCCLLRS